ncbi:FtsL-like putative cell division protein [Crocinitomicaceae bacterium]|nr:FtsL-like putative cell division protein [Crocinitomicaceae bacterium]
MDNEFLDKAQLDEQEAAQKKKDKKAADKAAAKDKKRAAKGKKPSKRTGPNAFVQILNGDFLTKEFMTNNLGFIFFIIFLMLLVVAKGYYGKELTRNVNTTQSELDEVTSDYFESKARLEEETRRVRLVEQLESQGLKETVNPTKVIRIKKKKNK